MITICYKCIVSLFWTQHKFYMKNKDENLGHYLCALRLISVRSMFLCTMIIGCKIWSCAARRDECAVSILHSFRNGEEKA